MNFLFEANYFEWLESLCEVAHVRWLLEKITSFNEDKLKFA